MSRFGAINQNPAVSVNPLIKKHLISASRLLSSHANPAPPTKEPCFPQLCKWHAFTIDSPRSALRPLHLAARENFFPQLTEKFGRTPWVEERSHRRCRT